MDTCFPLLQPKHHCVKVTGERNREKPTNHKSESKNGSRAGQEASKRWKEWEAGGGEKALLLTREDIAKEKSCRRCSAVREARPSTGQGGWKVQRILEGGVRGVTVSSCPLCAPEPFADLQGGYGWESCSKSWERWRRGVSQKCPPSWLNRTSSVTWRERENKRGHNSWSSWWGNFFKLKAWTEALHLITYRHAAETSVKTLFGCSSELKSACGVVPQRALRITYPRITHFSFSALSWKVFYIKAVFIEVFSDVS